jgi:hypothetical protein
MSVADELRRKLGAYRKSLDVRNEYASDKLGFKGADAIIEALEQLERRIEALEQRAAGETGGQ